jgi:hypothetical protein
MAWCKRSNNIFFMFTGTIIQPACFDRQPDALWAMSRGLDINRKMAYRCGKI